MVGSHGKGDDYDIITFTITMVIKQGIFKCIKCKKKKDELHDVSTC
jgi:hypothetical protein